MNSTVRKTVPEQWLLFSNMENLPCCMKKVDIMTRRLQSTFVLKTG